MPSMPGSEAFYTVLTDSEYCVKQLPTLQLTPRAEMSVGPVLGRQPALDFDERQLVGALRRN